MPAFGTLALALTLAVAALPAAAKPKQAERKAEMAQATAVSEAQAAKTGRKHCGQRAYSVSVGNPAFKDRLALWPAPCGW
ncbi:MAG: hypothetical protein ACRECX_12280 [Methyloceanibacter sp.]|uniref:hypothetical protein n=1 Tax=Methyloceanibacter sp. TaxID=1965321 RepID=UPI003D6D9872